MKKKVKFNVLERIGIWFVPFERRTLEISTIAFSFIFLERWQMPDRANIYKIIKIFCFFLW